MHSVSSLFEQATQVIGVALHEDGIHLVNSPDLYLGLHLDHGLRQFVLADFQFPGPGSKVYSVCKRHVPSGHLFLEFIGVILELQGKVYAGILLTPMLAMIERQHMPCYLDTELEKDVTIYRCYGFRVVEGIKFPGTEIRSWGMLDPLRIAVPTPDMVRILS